MTYVYKKPEGIKYNVSIKEWNKVFSRRGRWPFVKAEVYLNPDSAEVHYVVSNIGKALMILGLPAFYLVGIALAGHHESWNAIMDSIFDKSRGMFSSDVVHSSGKDWHKLLKLIM